MFSYQYWKKGHIYLSPVNQVFKKSAGRTHQQIELSILLDDIGDCL